MTKLPQSSKPLRRDLDRPLQSTERRKRDPDQPQISLEPMPARIEPCLAQLKSKPPTSWFFEIKWVGYRLANIKPSGVRVLTRGGHNWTHRFPDIVAAAKDLGVRQ